MQQNFGIEIPRSPTIVMGSFPSRNIGQLLHEEIVRLIVLEGFVPEGAEPITDPRLVSFEPLRLVASYDPTWSELLGEKAAA